MSLLIRACTSTYNFIRRFIGGVSAIKRRVKRKIMKRDKVISSLSERENHPIKESSLIPQRARNSYKRRGSKLSAQQVHYPAVASFFVSHSCFVGASTMRRDPRGPWRAEIGPLRDEPTTKYANASHKPPQQVHFFEEPGCENPRRYASARTTIVCHLDT